MTHVQLLLICLAQQLGLPISISINALHNQESQFSTSIDLPTSWSCNVCKISETNHSFPAFCRNRGPSKNKADLFNKSRMRNSEGPLQNTPCHNKATSSATWPSHAHMDQDKSLLLVSPLYRPLITCHKTIINCSKKAVWKLHK